MALIEEQLKTDLGHTPSVGFGVAADGDIDQVSGVANLKSALYRRFLTVKGSLVHRPDYGVGVKRFLNAPSSLENQRALAVGTKEQFEQDARVRAVNGFRFDVNDTDPSKIVVFVKVDVIGFGEVEMDFIPFGETVRNG